MKHNLFALCLVLPLCGCAGLPQQGTAPQAAPATPASIPLGQLLRRPGGYYKDDGPDGAPPVDLEAIADAQPKPEPLHPHANEPYVVFGKEYLPEKEFSAHRKQGTASWYGRKFHGQRTWSGEIYDMYAMSAAHPTLPVPSYARVTNLQNGKSAVVRINDRGPFSSGRMMDLSFAAAYKLGFAESGIAAVEVEAIVLAESAPPAEAPVATEPAIPVTAETAGIYLQLGAFSARANAESFRQKIQKELSWLGQPVQIQVSSKLFRLHLGPYRSRKEANAIAEKIRAELDFKPLLVNK
ncbi:MAG: septal ring lytic transglycosylase RlpA family protein [Betaproteobacteria bacterium]|nr:MAG: septal ring lytic transglycosylase RlpA family protein [Betaproteobacteria bacterium]